MKPLTNGPMQPLSAMISRALRICMRRRGTSPRSVTWTSCEKEIDVLINSNTNVVPSVCLSSFPVCRASLSVRSTRRAKDAAEEISAVFLNVIDAPNSNSPMDDKCRNVDAESLPHNLFIANLYFLNSVPMAHFPALAWPS